jgi:23S rRNA (adenine-N6)-dimethyltransferase
MLLCMQREAAEMFLGEPRTSLRALLLKPWFEVAIVYRFARQDFTPAPRVDVVMLRLRKRGPPLIQPGDTQCFRNFLIYSFTGWQPTTGSRLHTLFTRPQRKYIQRALGVDLSGTPTSLSLEQWLGLFDYFKTVTPEQARRLIEGSEKRLTSQQQGLQKIHRTRSSKDPPRARS